MAKRGPSIKEVAQRAGVSTATVSNVFSGAKPVNADLADRVRKSADEIGYQVNRAASVLRTGRNRIVPVLVPDLSDPFFTSLITEIEVRAEKDGYEVIVGNSRDNTENERNRLDALLSWQPAGLVIVPCTDEVPALLLAEDIAPFVIADRVSERTVADTISVDNRAAGRLAAEELCRLGHRHIVIAASDLGLHVIRERCAGAKEEIERWNGSAEVVEVGPMPDIGAQRLRAGLDENGMPTALIGMTDMTTLAILTFLAESDLTTGEDVSLVGFDDYPWMSARRTPLTAVRQPINSIADSIWERLTARMNGLDEPPLRVVHSCTLEKRESSCAPKDRTGTASKRRRRPKPGDAGQATAPDPTGKAKRVH